MTTLGRKKTDARVKSYRAVMIPERLHARLKNLAKREDKRRNGLVPKLLKEALRWRPTR